MKLTYDLFNKVEQTIRENGRPLDIKVFEYKFQNKSKNAVITELKKYQNDDGGFGHGIEPDFRLKLSSPMATTVALQYCFKIDLPTDDIIYSSAIKYFLNHFKEDGCYWAGVYENVKNEPHAPWWRVDKIEPPNLENWANPSAEISGYLFKFQKLVPEKIIRQLTKKIFDVLGQSDTIPGLLYNLMCWERVLDYLPERITEILKSRIERTYNSFKPLTQDKLNEIRIFFLTKSPSDSLNHISEKEVENLLDLEINLLKANGGCIPGWNWGMFEDEWEKAKKEWIGKMTIDLLITLKNYGRFDF